VRKLLVALAVCAMAAPFVWAAFDIAASRQDRIETAHWTRAEGSNRTVVVYTSGADYHTPTCWRPEPQVHYRTDEVGVILRFRMVHDFCTTEGGINQPVVIPLAQDLGVRRIVDDGR
jgi:hypothetical protein